MRHSTYLAADKRTGVCIGGVADGEIITADASRPAAISRVVQREARPPWPAAPEQCASDFVRSLYRFVPMRSDDGGDTGAWVYHGLTSRDAMERLLAVYARAIRLDERDTRNLFAATIATDKASVADLPPRLVEAIPIID